MVTGRDWGRVGAVAVAAMALVVAGWFLAEPRPGNVLLGVVVGLSMAALIGQPLVWTHGRHVVSADASALPVAVGVALIDHGELLAVAAVAEITAFIVARRRLGLSPFNRLGRLKLAGNVVIQVGAVGAAALTFTLWSPTHAVAVVVAATAAALISDLVSAALLDLVVGPEREGPPLAHLRMLLQSPTFVFVSLVGGLTVATALALDFASAWLALASAAMVLLAVQQSTAEAELVRLRRLVEVARDMPRDLERAKVLQFLARQARELTHASDSTISSAPPADDGLGVLIAEAPETWVHVHDRAGAGESFRRIERETLEDLGDMARLALRAVDLAERLRHEATHDALTGLPTRRVLDERWDEVVSRAARQGHDVGILYIDLDRFKVVNDALGHAIGDKVLAAAARRLRHAVRGGDVACRVGGDEFIVVAEDVGGEVALGELGDRLRTALATPDDDWPRPIRASIGHVLHPGGNSPLQRLIEEADEAMYAEKRASRV